MRRWRWIIIRLMAELMCCQTMGMVSKIFPRICGKMLRSHMLCMISLGASMCLKSFPSYETDFSLDGGHTRTKGPGDSRQAEWGKLGPLIPALAKAYLWWQYPSDHHDDPPVKEMPSSTPNASLDFSISIVDLYSLKTSADILRSAESKSPSEALALSGYIWNSPINPSLAVSIRTLELYQRICLRKASFSVEAFAKVICDMYSVSSSSVFQCIIIWKIQQIPYRWWYRNLLSETFDIYLAILRVVDKEVRVALGHDTPNWQVLNACPSCTYEVWEVVPNLWITLIDMLQLEDEPPRTFKWIIPFDGNSSMKLMH